MKPEPQKPDPHHVRDGMIAEYTDHVRKHGVDPDPRDIERIVAADLAVTEAVEREAKAPGAAPTPCVRDESENAAKAFTAERGLGFYRRPEPEANERRPIRDPLLDRNPLQVSARFPYAMARIKRILERGSGGGRPKGLVAAVQDMAIPVLAKEFLDTFFDYNTGRGEYRGLSQRDRARLFVRRVEDICDKSTGRLGPWWVPK